MILAAIHCQKANFRQWVTSLMRCKHIVDFIVVVVVVVVVDVHVPNKAEMTARLHPSVLSYYIR